MKEKRILIQGAVSILVLIALILFVEWMSAAEEFTWFPFLYEFPIETVIVLASIAAFLCWLTRALHKWLIGPIIRWFR